MCRRCHTRLHENPIMARELGHALSAFTENPWEVPFKTAEGTWVFLDCEGHYVGEYDVPSMLEATLAHAARAA